MESSGSGAIWACLSFSPVCPGGMRIWESGRYKTAASPSKEVEPAPPARCCPSPRAHLPPNSTSQSGRTNLALGPTRSAGREEEQQNCCGCPGLAPCGCGISGVLRFSRQFISHRKLQGWIKLLKTWSVFSPPEALDPATPTAVCNCRGTRIASRQQGMGVGRP